jgi:hypothetical protein
VHACPQQIHEYAGHGTTYTLATRGAGLDPQSWLVRRQPGREGGSAGSQGAASGQASAGGAQARVTGVMGRGVLQERDAGNTAGNKPNLVSIIIYIKGSLVVDLQETRTK